MTKKRISKEEKIYQNILSVTRQFLQGKGYTPLNEEELLQRLNLPELHQANLKRALKELTASGLIDLHQSRYTVKRSNRDVINGSMHAHARGFGFVSPEDSIKFPEDIFIPKHMMGGAIDGDEVEVLVLNQGISDKGPEGRVLSIIKRSRTNVAGIVSWIQNQEILVYAPLLGNEQRVVVQPPKKETLKLGDRVVLEVIEWGSKDTETIGKLSHIIGNISDASCDVAAAIEEYDIRATFSAKAKNEAKSFGTRVKTSEIAEREDFREWECVTIDPDTAKDFDDAISLTKDKQGRYHLGIHIADVSHYVTPGSAIDTEAKLRCNSVYFPGKCVPMLPEELSSHLCSLKPDVNRLTASVIVTFDKNGEQLNYRMSRSVIRSSKRFTYREAKEVLDGKKKSPHTPLLKRMVELCALLKKKRYERGSIEFALPDLVIKIDEKGVPTGTEVVEYDITHQMIEEFMLKANELVAKHLSDQGKNLTYRIHEEPSNENLKEFSALATVFGFRLSEIPTTTELQQLFDEATKTPYGQYLATNYIRRMKMAYYSPNNIGHYGLSLEFYCHFTSPIRRYVDLVAHRILFGEDDNLKRLEQISNACSDQERVAAKAENNVTLLKKLRLLEAGLKKDPRKQYEAIVTTVKPFGIVFDVAGLSLDGFLHVSELESDYFIFDDARRVLKGKYRGITYTAGDRIIVMLREIDLITLEAKWGMVGSKSTPKPAEKNVAKHYSKPSKKHVEKPHAKHPSKYSAKLAAKAVEKQPSKPSVKPAAKPVAKSNFKHPSKPPHKTAKRKPVEKPKKGEVKKQQPPKVKKQPPKKNPVKKNGGAVKSKPKKP